MALAVDHQQGNYSLMLLDEVGSDVRSCSAALLNWQGAHHSGLAFASAGYAALSGFDGDDDDWLEEYGDLCEDQGWDKAAEAAFLYGRDWIAAACGIPKLSGHRSCPRGFHGHAGRRCSELTEG